MFVMNINLFTIIVMFILTIRMFIVFIVIMLSFNIIDLMIHYHYQGSGTTGIALRTGRLGMLSWDQVLRGSLDLSS